MKDPKSAESGTELIEFLALLPVLLMVGTIIVQVFFGGQTILLAVSGSREAARAMATCQGDPGAAAARATGGLTPSVSGSWNGDEAVATVELQVPSVFGPFLHTVMPRVSYTSRMLREKTRCGW